MTESLDVETLLMYVGERPGDPVHSPPVDSDPDDDDQSSSDAETDLSTTSEEDETVPEAFEEPSYRTSIAAFGPLPSGRRVHKRNKQFLRWGGMIAHTMTVQLIAEQLVKHTEDCPERASLVVAGLTRDEWLKVLQYDPEYKVDERTKGWMVVKPNPDYTDDEKASMQASRLENRRRQFHHRRVLRRMYQLGLTFKQLAPYFPPYDFTFLHEERARERLEAARQLQESEAEKEKAKESTESRALEWRAQFPNDATIVFDDCVNCRLNGDTKEARPFRFQALVHPQTDMLHWQLLLTESLHDYRERAGKTTDEWWWTCTNEHLIAGMPAPVDSYEHVTEMSGEVEDNALTRMLCFKVTLRADRRTHRLWCNHDLAMKHRHHALSQLWRLSLTHTCSPAPAEPSNTTSISDQVFVRRSSETAIRRQASRVKKREAEALALQAPADVLLYETWTEKGLRERPRKPAVARPLVYDHHIVHYGGGRLYRLDVAHSKYSCGKFLYWHLICNTLVRDHVEDHVLRYSYDDEKDDLEGQYVTGNIVLRTPLTELLFQWLAADNASLASKIGAQANEARVLLYRQTMVLHADQLWD